MPLNLTASKPGNPARQGKEFAMLWIAALGLMIGTMASVSAICAELTFRRTLEPRER